MSREDFAYAEERKNKILQLLETNDRVQVTDLVNLFHVSGSTVRSDLRELEKNNQLVRTHGGAIPSSQRTFEDPLSSRKITEGKEKIAEAATNYINDGDSLVIDTGTSCVVFAEALANSKKKKLRIITYDLKVATILSEKTNYEIIMIGGLLRNGFDYSAGESAIRQLKTFLVDKAIIATNSFTVTHGYSTPDLATAELKSCLFSIARKKIVLCNGEKIGKDSFKIFGSPDLADLLIVDYGLDELQIKQLARQKVEVIIAK